MYIMITYENTEKKIIIFAPIPRYLIKVDNTFELVCCTFLLDGEAAAVRGHIPVGPKGSGLIASENRRGCGIKNMGGVYKKSSKTGLGNKKKYSKRCVVNKTIFKK